MTLQYNPPPTYAEPVIETADGHYAFNPVWLKWYIDLTTLLNVFATSGTPAVVNGSGQIVITAADGTAPIITSSTTEVANLHAAVATKLATARTIGGVSFDGTGNITVISATGDFLVGTKFGCNGKAVQAAFVSGGAAPSGGVGTSAGGWDTSANRDAAITLLNNIRAALVANGIMS